MRSWHRAKRTGSVTEGDPEGIYVLAGPNGAGKSSVLGHLVEAFGGVSFDADAQTRELLAADAALDEADANRHVWHEMVHRLREAICRQLFFVFETTLGGQTIFQLLQDAALEGTNVRVWYLALATPDLHVERVRQRVAEGGHDIPTEQIRDRYDSSRLHLIGLIPVLKELWVYDNTAPRDPDSLMPQPTLLLHMADAKMVESCPLEAVPEWAKGIVLAALKADPTE